VTENEGGGILRMREAADARIARRSAPGMLIFEAIAILLFIPAFFLVQNVDSSYFFFLPLNNVFFV
jgi:hypothetical protein